MIDRVHNDDSGLIKTSYEETSRRQVTLQLKETNSTKIYFSNSTQQNQDQAWIYYLDSTYFATIDGRLRNKKWNWYIAEGDISC